MAFLYRSGELRVGVELLINEPPFVQATSRCYAESAYLNSMFQVFQMFQSMLQVLYIDVAKVDWDVAHVLMAIHVCFRCMFQVFHLFQIYVTSVLSGCYKNRSGYFIYMHVASICFQVF
jgi:hypothetical protein